MAWHHLRCTFSDWQRDYKRHTKSNLNHGQQGEVIQLARNTALKELHASGQAKYKAATLRDISYNNETWNQGGDPGANYKTL
jgi:hypothetical protein